MKLGYKKQEISLIINETENLTPNLISYKGSFTKEEHAALQSLNEN